MVVPGVIRVGNRGKSRPERRCLQGMIRDFWQVQGKRTLAKEIDTLDKQAKVAGIPAAEQLKLEGEKGQKQVRHDAAETKEKALNDKLATTTSPGFWGSILSDGESIRFDRFQIVVWTVVLGVVFVNSVWARLTMPDFNATLLTLMGISSGTYLGFKIPDR